MKIAAADGQNSGKEWSFRTKVLAIIFVVVVFVLNAIFRWGMETGSIVAVGVFIAGVFLPVDVSKIRQAGRPQEDAQ